MTKQQPGATDSSDRPALAEMRITPLMVEAGVEALSEVSLVQPLGEIAEKVFVAMIYASDLASSTKALT